MITVELGAIKTVSIVIYLFYW